MPDQKRSKKRAKAESYDPEDLVIFGIDIPAEPEHPLVDEDFRRVTLIDDAMVRNIDALGVLLPIVVLSVQLPDGPPAGGCEALMNSSWWQALAARGAVGPRDLWGQRVTAVTDGRRRVLHARLANKLRHARGEEPWLVRSVARRGSEHDVSHKDASLSANRYRSRHSALAEARQIASRRNAGASWEHCETIFGMSVSTMENRLALLDLAPSVHDALDDGRLGAMAALSLRGFAHADQEALLERALAEGGPKRGLVPRIQVLAVELGMRSTGQEAPLPFGDASSMTPAPDGSSSVSPVRSSYYAALDSWGRNVRDSFDTPIRRDDWIEITEPGEVVFRGQVMAASEDPDDGTYLLTVLHPMGLRNGQVLTRQVLASSAHARAIANLPSEATPEQRLAYAVPGSSLTDALEAANVRHPLVEQGPAQPREAADHSRQETASTPDQASEPEPHRVGHKVLERILRHPVARKLLMPDVILTLEWIVGRATPPRRVAAALEALNAPVPAEPATGGKKKKRAIRKGR